jgi:hypothetical protein
VVVPDAEIFDPNIDVEERAGRSFRERSRPLVDSPSPSWSVMPRVEGGSACQLTMLTLMSANGDAPLAMKMFGAGD